MSTWDLLVSDEELENAYKVRSNDYIEDKVDNRYLEQKLSEGWILKKENKKTSTVKKLKPQFDIFENKVWCVLKKMGFTVMNSTNKFNLSLSDDNPNLTKQIDIIAIDDETCIFVECKSTETLNKSYNFKTELESISNNYPRLCQEVQKRYPNRKFKYVFATNNYVLGSQDLDRLKEFKIAYFDNDIVDYYSQLTNHLSKAAKYQLLGNLFSKQTIKGLEIDVPAIRSQMGGITYYAFTIEPEKLLKISYILHRNNANHDLMPTYQRLIKKDRLTAIRKFVNDGGYFPNSLIISLDVDEKNLQFDLANIKCNDTRSKLGVLHLPKQYQSAYIIDGQHRLYGYSDSIYEGKNSIPVVAFVNMDKMSQIKIFMDINQNQKAVPLALRNTLNIDLLWDSDKAEERKMALILSLALKFGEDHASPLFGRIVTGENTSTDIRVITIEYIKDALEKTNFFNTYKRNSNTIIKYGYFDHNNNQETHTLVFKFLVKCLDTISDLCKEEWNKNSKGYLTINNAMYGIIVAVGRIVDVIMEKNQAQLINDVDTLYKECEDLIVDLCDVLMSLDPKEIKKIKEAKGAAAKNISANAILYALSNKCPEIMNAELQQWINDHYVNYNAEVSSKLDTLFKYFINKTQEALLDIDEWLDTVCPEKIRMDIISKKANEEHKTKREIDYIEYVNMPFIKEIATYSTNWTKFMKKILTNEKMQLNQTGAISNIAALISIYDLASKDAQLKEADATLVDNYYNAFCLE